MTPLRLKGLITRIHLWAGLLLGLQVTLWMASGPRGGFESVRQADYMRAHDR